MELAKLHIKESRLIEWYYCNHSSSEMRDFFYNFVEEFKSTGKHSITVGELFKNLEYYTDDLVEENSKDIPKSCYENGDIQPHLCEIVLIKDITLKNKEVK